MSLTRKSTFTRLDARIASSIPRDTGSGIPRDRGELAPAQHINRRYISGALFDPDSVDDYARFIFILARYSETSRLFPPVQQIPKVAAEDMRIVLEKDNSQDVPSSISNGTEFDGPMPHFRASEREPSVLPAGVDRKEGNCLR